MKPEAPPTTPIEPYIEGERVLLRRARSEDVPRIIAFYRDNAEHFAGVDPARPPAFYTEVFWRRRLASLEQGFREDRLLHLFVFPRERAHAVIGVVNFSNFVRGAFQACHLGYAIDKDHEGKGLMREALALAIPYVFGTLGMHRIMANYLPHNLRSAVLLARMGFVAEGYARKYLRIAGRWQDFVMTSLVNDDWQPPAEEPAPGRAGADEEE